MSVESCRLCHRAPLRPAFTLERAPGNIQRLFRPEELHQDRPIRLQVLHCGQCGFVQIHPQLDAEYYDDYLMTTTHSRQMQEYQSEQARGFVETFGLAGKRVKEMGCGDGNYLDHLRAAGAIASGIEPSARFRELAVARGYAVESGYVTAERQLDGAPFDAFVTRQVLEHVYDIHGFLTGIRNNLVPHGVGLVEVPSLEKALADRRFYDFFTDHVNYFSRETLQLALEMNGFDVLETRPGMFDEYNIAVVRRREFPVFDDMAATVSRLAAEMREFVRSHHAAGRKVAVWGAGGKGLSVLAAAGIDDIDLLVDADPHKAGLLTPVSHLLVQSPQAIKEAGIGAVIVTAMAYHHEILRTLADELGFRGSVALLGHGLHVLPTATAG